jgi:hypothetical protein
MPEGAAPEAHVPEGAAAEPDGAAAAAGVAAPAPGETPAPTLQEEFAELSPELRRSMLGRPAQMITGLLIGALVLVALLIGATSLAKNGAVPLIPPPTASPSAIVVTDWRA